MAVLKLFFELLCGAGEMSRIVIADFVSTKQSKPDQGGQRSREKDKSGNSQGI